MLTMNSLTGLQPIIKPLSVASTGGDDDGRDSIDDGGGGGYNDGGGGSGGCCDNGPDASIVFQGVDKTSCIIPPVSLKQPKTNHITSGSCSGGAGGSSGGSGGDIDGNGGVGGSGERIPCLLNPTPKMTTAISINTTTTTTSTPNINNNNNHKKTTIQISPNSAFIKPTFTTTIMSTKELPQNESSLRVPSPQLTQQPQNAQTLNTDNSVQTSTNSQTHKPLQNGTVPIIKHTNSPTTNSIQSNALSKSLASSKNNGNSSNSKSSLLSTSTSTSTTSSAAGGIDLNSLSYHGIRKLAPMPNVNTKCIPIAREGGNGNHSNKNSPRIPNKFGLQFSTGSPPLTPNLEDTNSGYSPLLKRGGYSGGLGGLGGFAGFSAMATPPKFSKNKKNKPENSIIGVLAAQTLKIASINGLGELDKLENDLEEEINYENKSNANTVIGRLRREGHHHLHSKVVLFLVVILNIIDCLLVMGELTLDFHHVSHLLQNKKAMIDSFADELEDKYSPYLNDLVDDERHVLLQAILDSSIVWPQRIVESAVDNVTKVAAQCHSYVTSAADWHNQSYDSFINQLPYSNWTTEQPAAVCFQPLVDIFRTTPSSEREVFKLTSFDEPNQKLIVVAHKLHYISVAILSVLVVLLLLKVVCAGKRFLRSKMAVFDGIVIVISFTLDVVFIKGIHFFNTKDFVIILTFLLPWRIIRVLNSLIAAVLDKQRLNLKIIYTQKKKITRNLTEVNNKVDVMQRQIQILQGLCSSRGITDGDVRKILGTDHKSEKHEKSESKKHHHGGHGLASMMALGKLAFQAADALAPMPDVKGRSTPTSPVSTPIFSDNNTNQHPLSTTTTTSTTATSSSTHSNSNSNSNAIPNNTSAPSSSSSSTSSSTSTSATNTANGVAHAPTSNGSVPKGNVKGTNHNNKPNNNEIIGSVDIEGEKKQHLPSPTEIRGVTDSQNNSYPFHEKSNLNQTAEVDVVDDATAGEDNSVISESLDVPEVSQSLSLDIESAATMSMDLRDDDDDDDDGDYVNRANKLRVISASVDDVNVEFEMENETDPTFSPPPAANKGNNHVNDSDATSKL